MDDDDGRSPDHGHPISSPCEPNGSGELTILWLYSPSKLLTLPETAKFKGIIHKHYPSFQNKEISETNILTPHLLKSVKWF